MTGDTRTFFLTSVEPGGKRSSVDRPVAVEQPVAIEVNGIGYAVLMATPAAIDDLAYGFLRSERLIDRAEDVTGIDLHQTGDGTILRIWLAEKVREHALERVRHRVSESSCGLCGIENLEQAMRPLPTVTARSQAGEAAIFAALARLEAFQPLNRKTGAVHVAALCGADGAIRLAREDVGRHNAFDKLLGAMMREGLDWAGGFALLSSRCSYELVEKAALAGCPLLVTISAPTTLALDRARQCGLQLAVLARQDSYCLTPPDRD